MCVCWEWLITTVASQGSGGSDQCGTVAAMCSLPPQHGELAA